jgi:hypothetical protein
VTAHWRAIIASAVTGAEDPAAIVLPRLSRGSSRSRTDSGCASSRAS